MKLSILKTFSALFMTFLFAVSLISCSSVKNDSIADTSVIDVFASRRTTTATRPTSTTRTTSTTISTYPFSTVSTTSPPETVTTTEEAGTTSQSTATTGIATSTSSPPFSTLTTTERETVLLPNTSETTGDDSSFDMSEYLDSYAIVLRSYIAAYGETRTGSVFGSGLHSSGVAFADLIDLDGDDIYELVIGYSAEASGKDSGNNDIIDIYTFRNGSAVRILSVRPRHTYGSDNYTYIYLTNIRGEVYLRVDDSDDAGNIKMQFFLYNGSTVETFTVTASAKKDSKGKITYSSLRLDGKPMTSSEFGEIIGAEKIPLNLSMAERDYRLNPDRLLNFLTGKNSSYKTLLINATVNKNKPSWADKYVPQTITFIK